MADLGQPSSESDSLTKSLDEVEELLAFVDLEDTVDLSESVDFDLDAFRMGDDWWIRRPPAENLEFVLKSLSPGFAVDPHTRILVVTGLQSVIQLQILTEKLMSCEEDEEMMVPVCKEMADLLPSILSSVIYVRGNAGSPPVTATNSAVLRIKWAMTWLVSLANEHEMLGDPSPDRLALISGKWDILRRWWPSSRTGKACDMMRRLTLFLCDRDLEAVADFVPPDYWAGFEKSFLCIAVSEMFRLTGRRGGGRLRFRVSSLQELGGKCIEWAQKAEKFLPKEHEHREYVRLRVIQNHADLLKEVRQLGPEEMNRIHMKLLQGLRDADLRLCFEFPVAEPTVEFLKLELLELRFRLRGTGWEVAELVPNIAEKMDVINKIYQARYYFSCLRLRGKQLISRGEWQEGVNAISVCLSIMDSSRFGPPLAWIRKGVFTECHLALYRVGEGMEQGYQGATIVDRLEALLLAHGQPLEPQEIAVRFFRKASALYGFSGPATLLSSFTSVPRLVDHPPAEVLEDFWTTYEDCYVSLQGSDIYHSAVLVGNELMRISFQRAYPYVFMFFVHAVAAPICRLLSPPRSNIQDVQSQATGDGWLRLMSEVEKIPSEAFLCIEKSRIYPYLPQLEGKINWDTIQQAREACGHGTMFVLYLNTLSLLTMYTMFCVVVGDNGTTSCLNFSLDLDGIKQDAGRVTSAMKNRTSDDNSITESLERLYDQLIRPIFGTFKLGSLDPQRKLIINSVGMCKEVPFNILRNRDTGRYLFQEVTLSVTPSFALLANCKSRYVELQQRSLLPGLGAAVAVGDPQYLPFEQKPLPGSGKEVDAVCDLFEVSDPGNAHKIVKLCKDMATVEDLLEWMKKPSATTDGFAYSQAFVHIACHGTGGTLKDGSGDTGTLHLARGRRRVQGGAPEKRGIYREAMIPDVEDIMDESEVESITASSCMDFLTRFVPLRSSSKRQNDGKLLSDNFLEADFEWCMYMIVLSACNSATGVDRISFTSANFGRAFLLRGIPCCVLAHWPVDDLCTADLMYRFYGGMRKGMDVATALRAAMLAMLDTGDYQLHQLAPFVVSGLPTVCLPKELLASSL